LYHRRENKYKYNERQNLFYLWLCGSIINILLRDVINKKEVTFKHKQRETLMHKSIFSLMVLITLCIFTTNAQIARRYDVIIDEIFPDPTPTVGLPNAEFIEIKNTSRQTVNLQGWHLLSTNSRSGSFGAYNLPPDSFLIITSLANSALFTSYPRVLGIASFPALDNAGTQLSLTSKEGATIHSVSYNNTWFQNDVKSDGGWSLEMIDTHNPCSGFSNWKASTNVRGGTPGTKNAVDGDNPDLLAPALLRASAVDSLQVVLTFSEPVDSVTAGTASNYSVSDGIGAPVGAAAIGPGFNTLRLLLAAPVVAGKVYVVTASNIRDCSGNVIRAAKTARLGVSAMPDSMDIVINELLFNPKPTAVDFVEIYNRSQKVVNLNNLYIASRSLTTNALAGVKQLTAESISLFPGDYFVISENASIVKKSYAAKNPYHFIDVAMPSFPDEEGVVVLLNSQGRIIDELHYNAKWHFALIDNGEGISLERTDYNKPTQHPGNWTSAASTVGFATPSYQNSQFNSFGAVSAEVSITPKTFSPDNDGFEDYTMIQIRLSELGYIANITIFDARGRPVKDLAKNASLAATSSFRWDGLNDKFQKVPVGVYVMYTEVFNLSGKKKVFKNTVIVAARF
jgi:hypothetical protein